jgi:hypothetical protein
LNATGFFSKAFFEQFSLRRSKLLDALLQITHVANRRRMNRRVIFLDTVRVRRRWFNSHWVPRGCDICVG